MKINRWGTKLPAVYILILAIKRAMEDKMKKRYTTISDFG